MKKVDTKYVVSTNVNGLYGLVMAQHNVYGVFLNDFLITLLKNQTSVYDQNID